MKSLMGCLAAVLLSVAWASAAQGQSGSQAGADTGTPAPARVIGGPLAGIDVLQMSVAPLSDQARACGLEGSLILDSFQQTLGAKGIVVQQAAHGWVQVQATPLRDEGEACITPHEARAVTNNRYIDRTTD